MNMHNKTVLLDLHYLPSLEYFACIKKYNSILIEKEEYYIKQTYRNRCHILSANQVERLTVPVVGGRKKIKAKDIRIDYEQRWISVHWRTIMSSYGRAPFYEYFADYFEAEFHKRENFLFDLNFRLLTLCLKLLKLAPQISFTDQYVKDPESHIIDLRSAIHPKRGFEQNGLYRPVPYQQVFGKGFVADLSVMDLLFCQGPESGAVLERSTVMD